jgi:hypothetical protein
LCTSDWLGSNLKGAEVELSGCHLDDNVMVFDFMIWAGARQARPASLLAASTEAPASGA